MTRVVFYSLTGQCRRFIRKLDLEGLATELTPANPLPQMVEDFILLVPSYDEADVEVVDDFLADNHHFCIGLIGSGNRNLALTFVKLLDATLNAMIYPFYMNLNLMGQIKMLPM